MEEGVAVVVQSVGVAAELEVEVNEHIVIASHHAVHQGCVQGIIFCFYQTRPLQVDEKDSCLSVACEY